MKCSNCGQDVNEGDNYCSSCNFYLNDASAADTAINNDTPAGTPEQILSPDETPEKTSPSSEAAPVIPTASPQSIPQSSPYSQQPQSAPHPGYVTSPVRTPGPPGYHQSGYYPPYTPRVKQPFTITDCYIIIGFVLAIIGVFSYAFILLPASIGFSIVGFVKRTNTRTLGLSIAGIVVGVVSSLIKLGTILHELGLIPDWLSAGIF